MWPGNWFCWFLWSLYYSLKWKSIINLPIFYRIALIIFCTNSPIYCREHFWNFIIWQHITACPCCRYVWVATFSLHRGCQRRPVMESQPRWSRSEKCWVLVNNRETHCRFHDDLLSRIIFTNKCPLCESHKTNSEYKIREYIGRYFYYVTEYTIMGRTCNKHVISWWPPGESCIS